MIKWQRLLIRVTPPPDPVRLAHHRVLNTLYQTACAVCRVPRDGPICPECHRGLWRETRRAVGDEVLLPGSPIRGWSLGAYRGRLRRGIRALKFEGALELAHELGRRLAETVPDDLLPEGSVIVPVPMHPDRRRERGFNHVAPLAWQLARHRGLPSDGRLLERTRSAPSSPHQSREARQSRVMGAFRLAPGKRAPASVVLVDDVWTTGATARAVLGTLREAGVADLTFVALARALPAPLKYPHAESRSDR